MLEDIAILTGGKAITEDLGIKLENVKIEELGRAKRVRIDKDNTTIVEGAGKTADIQARIAQIKKQIEGTDSDYDKEKLQERLAKLAGGVAIIKVGAGTEVELKEKKHRVEDALAATRAAVEEGVVTGGGVALLRTQPAVRGMSLAGDEQVGRDIVLAALEAPARQIADNAGEPGTVSVERIREHAGAWGYNALAGRYEDLEAAGILDPAKVTRCALQHAASIGAMVLTTDAIVVDSDDDTPDGGREGDAKPE